MKETIKNIARSQKNKGFHTFLEFMCIKNVNKICIIIKIPQLQPRPK